MADGAIDEGTAVSTPYVYRTTYPRSGTPYFCNEAMIEAGVRALMEVIPEQPCLMAFAEGGDKILVRQIYLAMEATRQATMVPEPDAGLMGPDWRARMAAEPVPLAEAQAGEAGDAGEAADLTVAGARPMTRLDDLRVGRVAGDGGDRAVSGAMTDAINFIDYPHGFVATFSDQARLQSPVNQAGWAMTNGDGTYTVVARQGGFWEKRQDAEGHWFQANGRVTTCSSIEAAKAFVCDVATPPEQP